MRAAVCKRGPGAEQGGASRSLPLFLPGLLLLSLLAAPGCGGDPTGTAASSSPGSAPYVPETFSEEEVARILRLSPLPPAPADPTNAVEEDPLAIELGRQLFYDPGLSRDGARSCATCHDPALGWSDGQRLGQGEVELNRHVPSLWNVAHLRWFFWDGRADTLWSQALEPLENPLEQATSRLAVAHHVASSDELRRNYEQVFGALPPLEDRDRFPPTGRPVPADEGHEHVPEPAPQGQEPRGLSPRRGHLHRPGQGFYHPHQRAWDAMTEADQQEVTRVFANVGKALAAFQRRIRSGPAPLDVFVEGLREHDPRKLAALDESARRGLQLFVGEARCILCHSGPLLTDMEFHDISLPSLSEDMAFDEGRQHAFEHLRESPFRGDGPWSDAPPDPSSEASLKLSTLPLHAHALGEMKTPSLRNVALTAPYMHQGQLSTLEEVVRFYSERTNLRESPPAVESVLQPLGLEDAQVADLVAFLESLTSLEPLPRELLPKELLPEELLAPAERAGGSR